VIKDQRWKGQGPKTRSKALFAMSAFFTNHPTTRTGSVSPCASRRRSLLWLSASLAVVGGLAGCGKKGDLELPPGERVPPVEPISPPDAAAPETTNLDDGGTS